MPLMPHPLKVVASKRHIALNTDILEQVDFTTTFVGYVPQVYIKLRRESEHSKMATHDTIEL
jgi:hypothetical protein